MQNIAFFIRIVLVAIFLTSAFSKIKASAALEQTVQQFSLGLAGPLLVRFVARVLPWCELTLALSLASGLWLKLGAAIVSMMLLMFTVLMAVNLAKGNHIRCNCFGALSKSDIGLGTLSRNAILTAGSLTLVIVTPWSTYADVPLRADMQYLSDPNTVALLMAGIGTFAVLLILGELDNLFRDQAMR